MTISPADRDNEEVNGAAWAAVLAAGIGCFVFGLLVDLAEGFSRVSHLLNFYNPAGDLSGKTTVGILVWLIVWMLLHAKWKNQHIAGRRKIAAVTVALILLGLLATFPGFFGLFGT